MKYLTVIFALMAFYSCSRFRELDKYYDIVDSTDKVEYYTRINDTFALSSEVVSLNELLSLKGILKRHIEPGDQRIFIPTDKIELYNRGRLLGSLIINASRENFYVNFQGQNFGFGFRLTYGIGMSL